MSLLEQPIWAIANQIVLFWRKFTPKYRLLFKRPAPGTKESLRKPASTKNGQLVFSESSSKTWQQDHFAVVVAPATVVVVAPATVVVVVGGVVTVVVVTVVVAGGGGNFLQKWTQQQTAAIILADFNMNMSKSPPEWCRALRPDDHQGDGLFTPYLNL